jgi:RNA polymerase sigma factor (sigma-70 family)
MSTAKLKAERRLTNDERAEAERLCRAYRPFLEYQAKRIARARPDLQVDDLMQEGRRGIVNAVTTFDASRGSIESWAVGHARFYMLISAKPNGAMREIPYETIPEHEADDADSDADIYGRQLGDTFTSVVHTPREVAIYERCFLQEALEVEIARDFGVTRQYVNIVKKRVWTKLQRAAERLVADAA